MHLDCGGPESIVVGRGVGEARRECTQVHAGESMVHAFLHFGDGIVDAGDGDHAQAEEPVRCSRTELFPKMPVVPTDKREIRRISLGVGAPHCRAESTRKEDLSVHSVNVELTHALTSRAGAWPVLEVSRESTDIGVDSGGYSLVRAYFQPVVCDESSRVLGYELTIFAGDVGAPPAGENIKV